jgi:hypothetical protein
VSQAEFNELHTNCVAALKEYVTLAELTTQMFAQCTHQALPLIDRMSLVVQEIAEEEARSKYISCKLDLFEAARMGYQHCG